MWREMGYGENMLSKIDLVGGTSSGGMQALTANISNHRCVRHASFFSLDIMSLNN